MTGTRDVRLAAATVSSGGRAPGATATHGGTHSPTTATLELPVCDLALRRATPADLPAIMAMVRAAFGYDLEAKLVERLEGERRVAVSVVAVSDGRIVGHALLSRVELIAPGEAGRPALALAPVAVAPDLQGRGIGTLVVRTCVRLADPRLPVFVIGDPAFYGRFGNEDATAHRVTQRFDVGAGHFMVRQTGRRPAASSKAALVERTLDYPAAFDGF